MGFVGIGNELGTVPRRVERLRRWRGSHAVFGVDGHRFEFRPPVPEPALERFESRWGVSLPSDYRYFLVSVGDGGAGPGYGLFPIGHYGDSAIDTRQWDEWMVTDLRARFPLTEAWNLPTSDLVPPDLNEDEEDRWFEQRDAVYFDPGLINGTIPIAHQGCAIWDRLVVSGPLAGQVWTDDRASDNGLRPATPTDFSRWYLQWLANCEAAMNP